MNAMRRPLLLGHRGSRATRTIPENTIASFDLALAHGCDGFEFDLRSTVDGQAVVCHDARVHGVEISRTPAANLPSLPRLAEVLSRYAGRAFLDIELKVRGLEQTVLQSLEAKPPTRGYVLSSFVPEVLTELARLGRGVPLGLICEDRTQLANWESLPVSCVILQLRLAEEHLVRTLHASGKKVFVWTVNESEQMRTLARWQVDALISDDTQLLEEALGEGEV
jgi:glycerophosphoryl diester phosphodiesterase